MRALALLFTLALLTATACDLNGDGRIDISDWNFPEPEIVCPEGEQRGILVQCSAFRENTPTFALWGTCEEDNLFLPGNQGNPPIRESFARACTDMLVLPGPYTEALLSFELGGLVHEGRWNANAGSMGTGAYVGGIEFGEERGGLYLAPGFIPPEPADCEAEFEGLGAVDFGDGRGLVLPLVMEPL